MTTFAAVLRRWDADFNYQIYAVVTVQVLGATETRTLNLRVSVREGRLPDELVALVNFALEAALPRFADVATTFYVINGDTVTVPPSLALHHFRSDARDVRGGEDLAAELVRWVDQDAVTATCNCTGMHIKFDTALAAVAVTNVVSPPSSRPMRASRDGLELHHLVQWLLARGNSPRWRAVEATA